MFTGHLPELMLVLVLGLIIFGPKRLPEIGEAMGKGIRSFKTGISHMGDETPTIGGPAPVAVATDPDASEA